MPRGDRNVGVAELGRDVPELNPDREKPRAERVPEILGAPMPDPSPRDEYRKLELRVGELPPDLLARLPMSVKNDPTSDPTVTPPREPFALGKKREKVSQRR